MQERPKVEEAPAAVPQWRPLVGIGVSRAILAWLLLMFHDPILTIFVAALACVGLLGAELRFRADRQAAAAHLLKAAIYGTAALLAYDATLHDKEAADLLVVRLAEYRQRHGDYPARLDALVPALLPALPRPGLKGFDYLKERDSYWLSYRPSVAGPCSYRPEAGAWNCQSD